MIRKYNYLCLAGIRQLNVLANIMNFCGEMYPYMEDVCEKFPAVAKLVKMLFDKVSYSCDSNNEIRVQMIDDKMINHSNGFLGKYFKSHRRCDCLLFDCMLVLEINFARGGFEVFKFIMNHRIECNYRY